MRKSIIILFFISVISLQSQPMGWSEQVITPTPPKLNCVAIYPAPTNYYNTEAWICGDSGTILYTSNAGTNWIYRNNSAIGNYSINIISELRANGWTYYSGRALCAFNSSTASYIYRTTNQGVNWTQVYQQPSGRIRGIYSVDSSVCYAIGDPVGGRWTILKSTNNGISFDSAGLYLTPSGSELATYNTFYYALYPSIMMFGTNGSRIFKSTNNGLNWTSVVIPFQNIYALTFGHHENNSQQGYSDGFAAGTGAYYSTNYGSNWTTITLPGTGDIRSLDRNNGVHYCKGSQIYKSTGYPPQYVLDYTSPNGGNYTNISMKVFWFEGGMCRGWAVKDNGKVSTFYELYAGVNKISSEIPEKYTLAQNYPNPFNPTTTLEFDIPNKSYTTLSLYDITGRLIENLHNGLLQPGRYSISWNGSKYASGVYFYTLKTESFQQTKRMVLVK